MAQLFDFKRVQVGPKNLEATVELAPSAPLRTGEDPEGTNRVLELLPDLVDHLCLGDSSPSFAEVVTDTELAHLLEHVAVELMARTDIAGDISCGQTEGLGERLYRITLSCPDDVLVASALSCAAWILQWAYSGGGDPRPDVDGTVAGLVALVASLDAPQADEARASDDAEPAQDAREDEGAPLSPQDEQGVAPQADDASDVAPIADDVAPAAPAAGEPDASDPTQLGWDADVLPKTHAVR